MKRRLSYIVNLKSLDTLMVRVAIDSNSVRRVGDQLQGPTNGSRGLTILGCLNHHHIVTSSLLCNIYSLHTKPGSESRALRFRPDSVIELDFLYAPSFLVHQFNSHIIQQTCAQSTRANTTTLLTLRIRQNDEIIQSCKSL